MVGPKYVLTRHNVENDRSLVFVVGMEQVGAANSVRG